MPATVRLFPSGHQFVVQGDESVLESALRSGLSPRYGCSNGSCGECRARILSGRVRQARFHDYTLREAEKREGYVLLCASAPVSDLEVEVVEAQGPQDMPRQSLKARRYRESRSADGVLILHLKLLRGRVFRFLAGQHATLTLGDAAARDIPIASCPCDGLNLQFHLRHTPGDAFAVRVFDGLKASDRVGVEGPWGRFTLDDSSARPLVFVAYDTAYAPVNSLIEQAVNLELAQPMWLFWYAPPPHRHYLHDYCRSLADALDAFHYVPVTGPETGQAPALAACAMPELGALVGSRVPDLSGCDVYAAGPRAFLEPLRGRLGAHGLPETRLFVDHVECGEC